MTSQTDAPDRHVGDPPQRRAGVFAFLAGPIAWFVHLGLCYGIGEFGCVAGVATWSWLGVQGIAWLAGGVSVATFAFAAAAAVLGYVHACDRAGMLDTPPGGMTGGDYLARSGAVLSGIIAVVIAVQSVPILFYLEGC